MQRARNGLLTVFILCLVFLTGFLVGRESMYSAMWENMLFLEGVRQYDEK